MPKYLLLLLFFILSVDIADAQMRRRSSSFKRASSRHGQLSYSAGIGITSYYGDLKEAIPLQPKYDFSAGVLYRVHPHVNLRAEANYYRIAGDDNENEVDSPIYDRNLNFRANNLEFSVQALGYVFDKYSRFNRSVVNPYAFIGIGFTTVNPEGKLGDTWYKLRPLATERTSNSSDPTYSPVALVVPFGIGISVYAIRGVDLSAEIGMRYTGTDYLDDVSTNYAMPFGEDIGYFGSTPTEIIARRLSDRREYSTTTEGIKYRGNPSDNDWYMIAGIKAIYTPGASAGGARRRGIKRPKF